jgi:tryptophan-rich sensory protein
MTVLYNATPLPPAGPRRYAALAGWLLLTAVCAAFGAYASAEAGSFYLQLQRPDWAPPAWLFGPAWSVLYLMMAVAAWRATRSASAPGPAAAIYVVQLVANAWWTWLFFAWRRGLLASAEIVVLWLLIVATIAVFHRRDRVAAWLLLPYLAWVSFACALSFTIWRLNPAAL